VAFTLGSLSDRDSKVEAHLEFIRFYLFIRFYPLLTITPNQQPGKQIQE